MLFFCHGRQSQLKLSNCSPPLWCCHDIIKKTKIGKMGTECDLTSIFPLLFCVQNIKKFFLLLLLLFSTFFSLLLNNLWPLISYTLSPHSLLANASFKRERENFSIRFIQIINKQLCQRNCQKNIYLYISFAL